MDSFTPLTLNDQDIIKPYLLKAGKAANEYSFATLYMWSGIYHTDFRIIPCCQDRLLLIRSRRDIAEPFHFLYPMSLNGPVAADTALKALYAVSGDVPFIVGALSEEEAGQLAAITAVPVDVQPLRDSYDYLYHASDLAHLQGKKYQTKRNHLNAFINAYPGYESRNITPENIPACLEMNDAWCRLMGCNQDVGLGQEACAVRRAFSGFEELGLEGLMVLIEGKIIAYTLGELLTKNTWLVHVEKAFPEFRGAYQAVNLFFVRYAMEKYPHVEYINREDDSGDMGLRNAKMSYRPAFFAEKYMVRFNQPTTP